LEEHIISIFRAEEQGKQETSMKHAASRALLTACCKLGRIPHYAASSFLHGKVVDITGFEECEFHLERVGSEFCILHFELSYHW
jgi:hypothetical protein